MELARPADQAAGHRQQPAVQSGTGAVRRCPVGPKFRRHHGRGRHVAHRGPGGRRAPDFDPGRRPAYRTSPILRRWLIAVPGRVMCRSRQVQLRLPRGWWWTETFAATDARLGAIAVT